MARAHQYIIPFQEADDVDLLNNPSGARGRLFMAKRRQLPARTNHPGYPEFFKTLHSHINHIGWRLCNWSPYVQSHQFSQKIVGENNCHSAKYCKARTF